jgi:exodeoxyribonuclease X
MEAIIIDTETTGVEKPEVIQLAWVNAGSPLSGGNSNAIQSEMFAPTGKIQLGALATHHIIPSDLEGLDVFMPHNLPEAQYWIGHNVDFDWNACGSPEGVKRICTLALARYLWPENDSHSLGACLYHILPASRARELLRKAHDAEHDVFLCNMLLNRFLAVELLNITSWEVLWEVSERARIPTRMPFGKHRGEPIASLPRSYRSWCLAQPDLDPYVKKAIQLLS